MYILKRLELQFLNAMQLFNKEFYTGFLGVSGTYQNYISTNIISPALFSEIQVLRDIITEITRNNFSIWCCACPSFSCWTIVVANVLMELGQGEGCYLRKPSSIVKVRLDFWNVIMKMTTYFIYFFIHIF